jgi:hypothetical protein
MALASWLMWRGVLPLAWVSLFFYEGYKIGIKVKAMKAKYANTFLKIKMHNECTVS